MALSYPIQYGMKVKLQLMLDLKVPQYFFSASPAAENKIQDVFSASPGKESQVKSMVLYRQEINKTTLAGIKQN